jgi:hypothetical protein
MMMMMMNVASLCCEKWMRAQGPCWHACISIC